MSALWIHYIMWSVTETSMTFTQLSVTHRGAGEISRSMLQHQFGLSVPKQDSIVLTSQTVARNAQVTNVYCKMKA